MQFSRHLYAICGLGLILTAITLGSSKAGLKTPSAQSVLVTNASLPVTLSPAASIQVSNKQSSGPLLVRDVDTYARTPVEGWGFGEIDEPAISSSVNLYTVPAGKRLVVQTLVMRASAPSGQAFTGASVSSINLDTSDFEMLAPQKVEVQPANANGISFYYATASTPFYVKAGNTLQVNFARSGNTGSASYFPSYSGYLEDVPPGQ